MQINDRLHGFCVKSIREAAEVAGVLYELEYEKNGAKLLWLSRDDDNKTFSVTFKTTYIFVHSRYITNEFGSKNTPTHSIVS